MCSDPQKKGQLLRLWLHKNYSKLQMPYTDSEVTRVRIDICLSVNGIYSFGLLLCSRAQAIAIGQALVDGRWLDCVTHHDQLFRDEYVLYRPLQVRVFIHALPKEFCSHTLAMTYFQNCFNVEYVFTFFFFLSFHIILLQWHFNIDQISIVIKWKCKTHLKMVFQTNQNESAHHVQTPFVSRAQSSQKHHLQTATVSIPWRDILSHPGLRTSSLMTVTQSSLQMNTLCPVCISCFSVTFLKGFYF